MSERKKKRQIADAEPTPSDAASNRKSRRWLAIPILLLICGVAAYFLLYNRTVKTTKFKVGPVTGCQQIPQFVRTLGFGNGAAFSTSDRRIPGLILIEGDRKYQHPSWQMAGSLAPITRDQIGATYVGPAPWIDVLENKPDEQNRVYRVDPQTQEMKLFADLPRAADATSQNPYGVMGLSFDCDTLSLYVSSVAGSTRDETNGTLFQLDLSGKIVSTFNKTDAMGLAVFNTPHGKRLYFGLARVSEIWSVALNDKGSFASEPRKEISLEGLGPRGDDRVRRINFTPQNEMVVFGIEFSFNLIAPTEKQETIYRFSYDFGKDSWIYKPDPPQIVNAQPK